MTIENYMAIIYMIRILRTKQKYAKTTQSTLETHSHEGKRSNKPGQSYYAHYHGAYVKQCTICTLREYKIEKVSFIRTDANLTCIAKNFFIWLC